VRLYRLSAEQGDTDAQRLLGAMYQFGQGVPLDLAEAAKWYRLAADRGDTECLVKLGAFYFSGTGVKQDYVESAKLFRLAADQGNADAQTLLGLSYQFGSGVEKNEKEAVRLYRLASDQGNADAQNSLGAMYLNGTGVTEDSKEAIRLFRMAADQGNAGGQFSLGALYMNGINLPPSRVIASALFKLAITDPNMAKVVEKSQVELSSSISPKEVKVAENLSREMSKPGNFLKALDSYVKKPLVKERSQSEVASSTDSSISASGKGKNRLELFGVSLKGATRDELRVAFKQNGLKATREEDRYWVDTYAAEGVLEGANEFSAWYVAATGKFAYAEYSFPGFVDTQLVGKVIEMVSTKYGRPTSQRGDYRLGEVIAKWSMGQDMQIVVSRGWPDTTTTLRFIDLPAERQMNTEISSETNRQKVQKAKSQSNAF